MQPVRGGRGLGCARRAVAGHRPFAWTSAGETDSDDAMTEQLVADVAIVGGGIAGCSAALHLRKRGASVVLLERGTCGSQASGVNYGGVRQQGRDLPELPLARRSREMWGRLAEIAGDDCEFVASGHVKLARKD